MEDYNTAEALTNSPDCGKSFPLNMNPGTSENDGESRFLGRNLYKDDMGSESNTATRSTMASLNDKYHTQHAYSACLPAQEIPSRH